MTAARRRTGEIGEGVARERLRAAGYTVIAHNCRTSAGEIDIVVADARALIFVEVKTLRARAGTPRSGPARAALAVGPAKQRRLRTLARAWLASTRERPHRPEIRFDVIGVTLDAAGRVVDYEHVERAF